MNSIGTVR